MSRKTEDTTYQFKNEMWTIGIIREFNEQLYIHDFENLDENGPCPQTMPTTTTHSVKNR